ncbi:hypothetical protein BANRA_05386 [Escherichia coli]|nr:hypothetical protein BANRA_05386 [Escherichia coli]
MSSVLNKKTVTVIADTAIPIFERIAEEAKLKEGESVSTDTYTLVLTNDEMNDIINAHADLKEYLRKHAEKMNKDRLDRPLHPDGSVTFQDKGNRAMKKAFINVDKTNPLPVLTDSVTREFSARQMNTEFGHLNRGDMLTSEQHRCSNEKKKFQRRV